MSERAAYWRRLLGEWEQSGLSQAEFCRRRGLKAVNLAWWKRRLRGSPGRPRGGRQRVTRSAGERSTNHVLNCAPSICEHAVGGAACRSVRRIGSGCWASGNRVA